MKSIKKIQYKIAAMVLSVILLVCSLPVTSLAVSEGKQGIYGYYKYTIKNNEAIITKCYDIKGDISIPSTIEGYTVTSIGDSAFRNCTNITSVIIPNSVVSIGECAFHTCVGITDVIIPDSVISMGRLAFYFCSRLKSITIPDSTISIGDSAFGGCSSLKSITVDSNNKRYHSSGNCLIETESKSLILGCSKSTIPFDGSVKSIKSWSFSYSFHLENIIIPDTVTEIDDYAFAYINQLKKVTLSASISIIGNYAFDGCRSLSNVIFCGTQDERNSITIKDGNAFLINATWEYHTEHNYIENYRKNPTKTTDGYVLWECSDCKSNYKEDLIRIIIGDANLDGRINAQDLIVFQRKLVTYDNSEFDERLDANGDGCFDIRDLIRMKKHMANSNIILGKNETDVSMVINYTVPYKGQFHDNRLVVGDSCEVIIQFDKNSNTGIYGITEYYNGQECAGKGNDFRYEIVGDKIIIISCTDEKSKMEIVFESNNSLRVTNLTDNNGSLDCFRVGDVFTI